MCSMSSSRCSLSKDVLLISRFFVLLRIARRGESYLEGQISVFMHAKDLWIINKRQIINIILILSQAV